MAPFLMDVAQCDSERKDVGDPGASNMAAELRLSETWMDER